MENTLLELFDTFQDPIQVCAGSPVILAAKFEEMSALVAEYTEVSKTQEEILTLFKEQSKRFSACGGNNSDRFGVLRKNPAGGWSYLSVLVTEK